MHAVAMMNSSVRPGRVYRPAEGSDDVFVLGERSREELPTPGAMATASALLAAAEQRAAEIVAEAERQAAAMVSDAAGHAGSFRDQGYSEGYAQGRAQAENEIAQYVELARQAAQAGESIRRGIAEQSAALIARAVMLATRRIVGEYYESEPGRTAAACEEALRAAAGQDVLSIRVNPAIAEAVSARVSDAARYIRPDEGIEIGGCIIDLRHGTLDASLDARLSLMELALAAASGDDS